MTASHRMYQITDSVCVCLWYFTFDIFSIHEDALFQRTTVDMEWLGGEGVSSNSLSLSQRCDLVWQSNGGQQVAISFLPMSYAGVWA